MFLEQDRRPSSDGYDAIVIGSGPAGMTVAMELDAAGRRVLLIESEFGDGDRLFGGRTRYRRQFSSDRTRRCRCDDLRRRGVGDYADVGCRFRFDARAFDSK